MILCIGTTPAVQRVMVFRKLEADRVNRAVTTLDGPAGKSVNVAKVLKALGADPVAAGFLGGDRGDWIRAALVNLGIQQEFIQVAARTRECVTVVDEDAGQQTELVEESQEVESGAYHSLIEVSGRWMPRCSVVVLSGTLTPGGPVGFYRDCVRLAHESGAITVVDARGEPLLRTLEERPGVVKPNQVELAASLGRELPDEAAVLAGMRELIERGAQRVVVTDGSGPVLATDGLSFWRIAPPRIRAANPIGSGDAFTAGLAWRLQRGDDLGESSRWAAAAGAANALTLMPGEIQPGDEARLAQEVVVEQLTGHEAG